MIIQKFNELEEFGFTTFPLVYRDKNPAIAWKQYQIEKPSHEDIVRWDNGEYNAAVATGIAADLIVIDVDGPEAQKRIDQLNLPATPVVKTAKGRHYYFRADGLEISNSVNIEGIKLDVRGEGGYVVAPGSIHPDGTRYEWEVSPKETPIASIPPALALLLSPKSTALTVPTKRLVSEKLVAAGRFDSILNVELEKAVKQQSELTEGSRNDGLFRHAVRLANHVAAAGADWQRFASRLQIAAEYGGLAPHETVATLESAWKAARPSLSWISLARGWLYVGATDSFFHVVTGQQLTPKAFNTMHGEFNTFERRSLADNLTTGGFIDKIHDFTFDPSQDRGVIESEGLCLFNNYRPTEIEPVQGDAGPFEDFVSYLVPEEAERKHLLQMIAWTAQYPHLKLKHALLLTSTAQGIGKSILIDIWRNLLGLSNTRKTTSGEISSNYQSWIKDKLLILVEEFNLGNGQRSYNGLKDLITGDHVAVNEKYQVQREYPNMASFVFLSNLDSPILIEAQDRRFFVVNSPARPRMGEYYASFCDWWRANLNVIAAYLTTIDLSDFDRSAPPPETEAKATLRAASATPLDQELAVLLSDRAGPFVRDIGTIDDVRNSLPAYLRGTSLVHIGNALKRLGGVGLPQLRISGQWSQDKFRISPWAFRNAEYWAAASPAQRAAEYTSITGTLPEPDAATNDETKRLEHVCV